MNKTVVYCHTKSDTTPAVNKLLFYENLSAKPVSSSFRFGSSVEELEISTAKLQRYPDLLGFLHFEAKKPTNTTQKLRNTNVIVVPIQEDKFSSDKELIMDLAEGFDDVSLRTVYLLRHSPLSFSGGGKNLFLYGYFTKYINASLTEEFFGFADCHLPPFGNTFNCMLIVRESNFTNYRDISVIRFNQTPPFERTWRMELLLETEEGLQTRYFAYTRTKSNEGKDLIADQSLEDVFPFPVKYGLTDTKVLQVKQTLPGLRAFSHSQSQQPYTMFEVVGVNATGKSTVNSEALFWVGGDAPTLLTWAGNKEIAILRGSHDILKEFSAVGCSSFHTIQSMNSTRQVLKASISAQTLKLNTLEVPMMDLNGGEGASLSLVFQTAKGDLQLSSNSPNFQSMIMGEQVLLQTDLQMIKGFPYVLNFKIISAGVEKPVETIPYGPLMKLTYYDLIEEDGVARIAKRTSAPLEYIGNNDYVLDLDTKDLLTCKEAYTTDSEKGMMCMKKASSTLMPKTTLDLEDYPLYFLTTASMISYAVDSDKFAVLFYKRDKYKKNVVRVCFYVHHLDTHQERVECPMFTGITNSANQTSQVIIKSQYAQFIFMNGTGLQSIYYSNDGEVIYKENIILSNDFKTMDYIQYLGNKAGKLFDMTQTSL